MSWLKLCWRNLLRHKGRSLVVGMILFFGALIMTIGNGVVSGMDVGLERNIVQSFTGHLVLASKKEQDDNVFFKMMGGSVVTLPDYDKIKPILQQDREIQHILPIGKNAAMIINEKGGNPGFALLLGVNFDDYQKMFPNNIKMIEGRMPRGNEHGYLTFDAARESHYTSSAQWMIPKGCPLQKKSLSVDAQKAGSWLQTMDEVVLLGFNEQSNSSDVRSPILGIGKFKALNSLWGKFALIDIQSYRQAMGYFDAAPVQLNAEQNQLLNSDNPDAMFGASGNNTPVVQAKAPIVATEAYGKESWNLVLILLKDGVDINQAAEHLQAQLDHGKIDVKVIPWNKATGPIGSMAVLIKSALFVFVGLLFMVAAIIIMNTLSMATMERTTELGMMRAVGAPKSFLRILFLGETALLSALFGGLGIVLGAIGIHVLSALGLSTDNDILQMLYGGEVFQPLLHGSDYLLALVQLFLVTMAASLYPMYLVGRITPLDAIGRD